MELIKLSDSLWVPEVDNQVIRGENKVELVKVHEHLYVPVEWKKHHHYYADASGDREYSGITTIINQTIAKPSLIPWAARMAVEYVRENGLSKSMSEEQGEPIYYFGEGILVEAQKAHTKKKEAAGEHGTDTHALIEEWVNECINVRGGSPGYMVGDSPIEKFQEWAIFNVDHFLFSERRMANKELFIAGTADFAYVDKEGKRVIPDFKTSGSGIYYEMFLQTAGYQLLAEGEGDEPYDYRAVVRLDKKGNFEFAKRYDYETDKNAFLAALTIYRAQATYKTNK